MGWARKKRRGSWRCLVPPSRRRSGCRLSVGVRLPGAPRSARRATMRMATDGAQSLPTGGAMGEHKRRTARSTFEAAAKDRGVPVAIERIKFRGPEEMSALTHALVNHMQVHQRRHHAPPAVQPRYEPYQQADGSLVIYLRSLDVETSFSVARGRWWAMSDGEMAKPDPPSPTIVDEAGLAAAMCADYETLQLRSEQREALYEAAVAALFLFDRSQRSLMALREVVIRRSDIRTAAIQWYEHSDYPYAALYMALDRCWLSSVEE